MGSAETVLHDRSQPMSDWARLVSEAFRGPDRTALVTPDFRFVDYPYQALGWTTPHLPQNKTSGHEARDCALTALGRFESAVAESTRF